MTTTTPQFIPEIAQQRIVKYAIGRKDDFFNKFDVRSRYEFLDRQYLRQVDRTIEQHKAKFANQGGDPTKFQNIILPIIMPMIESAVTYQTEVFLSGIPIFGSVAKAGYENAALALDSLIYEHQVRGQWDKHLIRAIRDGFRYKLMAVECDWKVVKSAGAVMQEERDVVWQGNFIKRMDLYNTFYDTSVDPSDVSPEGEFAGYTELYSRVRLKKFLQSLPMQQNITKAFESQTSTNTSKSYFIPDLDEDYENIKPREQDWNLYFGFDDPTSKIRYKSHYHVTTIYCRIMPSDFKLKVPGANTPQIWKFIIVNNCVLIYGEKLTNLHDSLPIIIADPNDIGLGTQGKSMTENLMPFQALTSAFANSDIHARRRALSDRFVYDSGRINPAALRSDSPHIPAKPSATGTAIGNAIHQIPFEDSQFQYNNASMQTYIGMASNVTGINPVRQGQFVKGNKTKREFETVMGNSTGRDRLMSKILESCFFSPLKEIIKTNVLQFQPSQSVINIQTNEPVDIDTRTLKEAAVKFKMSDGMTPNERLIDSDMLQMAFQTIAQAPTIGAGYNMTDLFSYLMKSGGADLRPFEKPKSQLAYDQAVGQWNQTMTQVAQQVSGVLSKMDQIPEGFIQQLQQILPPMPTPEQFGYKPGQSNADAQGLDERGNELSVLDQVNKLHQNMLNELNPQQGQEGGAQLQ